MGKSTAGFKNKLKNYKQHLQEWGLDPNFNKELLLGGKVNTDGWSSSIYYLKKKDKLTKGLWQLHFSEIKHEKQIKQQGTNKAFPQLGNAGPYIFGKINNLYTLQLGYGREKLLLPDVLEGNISVSFRYSGGFSLAMLKPYYLKLIYIDYAQPNNPATLKEEKYSTANSDHFLNNGDVLAASKWSKGLDEIQYIPGLFAEACFVITPSKSKSFIQVVTLGANIAYYSKELPIMADQKAYPYQASLFAGLGLGKRWK
ncbi:hypothetical protein [Mucilaginibacter boryungensis]|uniref:Uncharacterized protein n=1 Tax=Mucilaginibacter boryungensis TaxID=768480 RepID=A0ABR9XLM7_9SPHI|nr:hypothetical protein [Mucilaginibacter boryungensis]MBE9668122.1 hypothetical protein [Mucilaginibacter boryungensis]